MKKIAKIILTILLGLVILALAINILGAEHFDVLSAQGPVSAQQRNLIIFTCLLALIVVVPVFIMLFSFAWRYRENNTKAKYTPDKANNKVLEIIWWTIPCVIILILSIVTWQTSHSLDPYKALDSKTKPINIQVVSLQWKWLFIYPDQHVASVNLMAFPEKTPLNLTLTSDAPMNSFWVPSLGSQVYTMSGMSTKLHLMANHTGSYYGSSANISGKGFASMNFTAKSMASTDFNKWVAAARQGDDLTAASYDKLAQPSIPKQPKQYYLMDTNLYDTIVMKYMMPDKKTNSQNMAGGM